MAVRPDKAAPVEIGSTGQPSIYRTLGGSMTRVDLGVLGNDGTLGGPGGSPLSSSVVSDSSATPVGFNSTGVTNGQVATYNSGTGKWQPGNALVADGTGQITIAPPAGASKGFLITAPVFADDSHQAFRINDDASGSSNGVLVQLEHYGKNAGFQNYALDIHNYPLANTAVVLHHYAGAVPGAWIDQCSNGPALRLKQAENATLAPGTFGNGSMLELLGYTSTVSSVNGVVTGNNTLTDATTPAAFSNTDVGKPITVGAVTTTIASVVSATQITTVSNALVNASGVTYSYSPYSTVSAFMQWTAPGDGTSAHPPKALLYHPGGLLMQQNAAAGPVLTLSQPAGGASTAIALTISQLSPAAGVAVTQNGSNYGQTIVMQSGATGFYGLAVTGYTHGIQATNSQNSGIALQVTKNGTGGGTCANFINKGTGDTVQWQIGSGPTTAVKITGGGSLVVGQGAALVLTATDGFLYLPTTAGVLTGVPTTQTGSIACWYDTTNNTLNVYNGAIKKVTLA